MQIRKDEGQDLGGRDELIVVGLVVDVEVGARDLVGSLGEEGDEGGEGGGGEVGVLWKR